MKGPATAQFHRVKFGDFEITSILGGAIETPSPNGMPMTPQQIFGTNVSAEEFAAVSAAAFLPTDRTQIGFTPTVVNTGAELVLFDTGIAAGGTVAALTAAGYTADQIDVVVISHMHPDHIGGLMGEAGPTFANARYVAGSVDHNYFMGAANEAFDNLVRPLNDKITFVDPGSTVVPGITALGAYGHTPGHLVFQVESAGKNLIITADTANHPVWSLAHPDWEVMFDADKAMAAESRRKIFGMIAQEKVPFIGYHMPFPSVGYVEARDNGFAYVPASYQLSLSAG